MNSVDQIIAEIGRGELTFPTHADVAFRVRLALDDPDLHLSQAAHLVEAEPLLATRAVAVANSIAFNRSGQKVSDVRSAVSRLGIRFIRTLATALVMRQMTSRLQSPACRSLSERLWEHSAHVAALANVLAKRLAHPLADSALFAGMVHEVGGFYLISRTDAYPDLLTEGGTLALAAELTIGPAVLKALAVPEDVVNAIEAHWQPRPNGFPPTNLSDLLAWANRLAPVSSPLQSPDVHALPDDPQATSLLAKILEQSSDEMAELASALRY